MRYYNTCYVGMPLPGYKTRTRREPFIRALRVLCKTCRPNSEASFVGHVLLFLVYVSGRVHSAKTCLFGIFQFEAFIHHHHVPVSGAFNSHLDSVKPLFHSPLRVPVRGKFRQATRPWTGDMRATNWRRPTDYCNELAKATPMSRLSDSEFENWQNCECPAEHLRVHYSVVITE